MKKALEKNHVTRIYDKSYRYYDIMHNLGTFGIDNIGRKYLVDRIVKDGDWILDAGGGTGITGLMALKKAGSRSRAVILDLSDNMLEKAREKAFIDNLEERVSIVIGDMYSIPFPDNCFDVVISTYSTCPLENPAHAVKEMLRVLKVNGFLGIAHSSEPKSKTAKTLSNWIESIIWKFPMLSLGCRNIDISDDLKKMNTEIIEDRIIGFIPWYFRLIILRKKGSLVGN
jgi:ubiquinone/menaquinone biosynthesis C-methylase UbiE